MAKEVPVEELEPGMTVKETVTDLSGRTLLQEGSDTTERIIRSLERSDISFVLVEEEQQEELSSDPSSDSDADPPEHGDQEQSKEQEEHIREQINHMFELVEDDEKMSRIKEISLNYHLSTEDE